MALKYGLLNKSTWRDDIQKGFSECFRVLKKRGVLVFKWNETDIATSDIVSLAGRAPLFGHRSGRQQKTHWLVFMK
jgi:ubiquinone/menaquinone biosynthesis C-methylase UbiE